MNLSKWLLPLLSLLMLGLLIGTAFAKDIPVLTTQQINTQKLLEQKRIDQQQWQYDNDHPTGPVRVIREPSSIDELNSLITIGTGASTQRYPMANYYGYERSAALYTAAEIGQGGAISTIAWYPTSVSAAAIPMVIYLKMVPSTTTTISSISHASMITGATMVWTGTRAANNPTNAWYTFTLSTPFNYDGTSNLIVIVEDNYGSSGTGTSTVPAVTYTTATNQFGYLQQDSSIPTGNYIVTSNRPNIQFNVGVGAVSMPNPINGAVSVPNNAVLSWSAAGGALNYDVLLNTSTPPVTVVSPAQTSTSYTSPSNLLPNQQYFWQVIAHDASSTNAGPIWSFTTASGAAPVAPSAGVIDSVLDASVTSLTVHWTSNSAGAETGFYILHSTDGVTYNFLDSVATGILQYTHSSLAYNTHHYYQIKAVNNGIASVGYTAADGYTLANIPGMPALVSHSILSITLSLNFGANPSGTQFALYDANSNRYVQANGTLNSAPLWGTSSQFGTTTTINSLVPNTNYVFELKARNVKNIPTVYSGSVSVTTNNPSSLPLFQNFSGTFPPLDWTVSTTGTSYPIIQVAGTPAWVEWNWWNAPNNQIDKLITPPISTVGVSVGEISFNLGYNGNTTFHDTLEVAYTTDGINYTVFWKAWGTGTGINALNGGNGNTQVPPTIPDTRTIAFPGAALGQSNVQIAFIGISAYGMNCYINNVSISAVTLPRIAFNTVPAIYGLRPVNRPASYISYVKNSGVGTLSVSGVTTAHGANITPSWTTHTIASGDSAAITLTWLPLMTGSLADTVIFTCDGTNNPGLLPVNGTAQVPVTTITQPFTTSIPTDWTVVNSNGSTYPWVYTATGNGGSNGAAYTNLYYSSNVLGAKSVLWTPLVNTMGVPLANITFDWWMNSTYTESDTMYVVYSLDFGNTYTPIWWRAANGTGGPTGTDLRTTATGTYYSTPVATGWANGIASVPAAALGQPAVLFGWVAVKGAATSSNSSYIGLDNITFVNLGVPHMGVTLPGATSNINGISYGTHVVGSVNPLTFTVRNIGSNLMNITGVATNHPATLSTNMNIPLSIRPGDSTSITVNWTPAVGGDYTDSLTLTHNGDNTPYIIPVTGSALAVHQFSYTQGFSSATPWPPAEWQIINPDNGYTWVWYSPQWARINFWGYSSHPQLDYLVSPVFTTVGMTNAAVDFDWSYLYDSNYNDSLEVAYTTDLGTTWNQLWLRWGHGTGSDSLPAGTGAGDSNPASSNYGHAHILLPAGALGQSQIQFAWIGHNMYGPDIFVSNIAMYNANTPLISFNPTTVSFGNQAAGVGNVSSTVYVKNTGLSSMHITNVTAATVTPSWVSNNIAVGDSVPLTVTWSPTLSGAFADTLVFTSNATGGNKLPVTGNVFAAVVQNPSFTPTSATAGSTFTFAGDFVTYLSDLTIDNVDAVVNGTSYPLVYASGSVPGTEHYTGSIVLSTIGMPTYYLVAYYHNSALVNDSAKTVTMNGPSVLPPQVGGPDAFGYSFKTSVAEGGPVFNWINHTDAAYQMTSTDFPTGDDNASGIIPLPFPFTIYDSTYTSLFVGTNGDVVFDQVGSVPSTSPVWLNGARGIYVWPGDMITAPYSNATNSRVRYEAFTSPRMFVITYDSLGNYSTGANRVSAQIILYPNGKIVLQYRDISNSWSGRAIGIQNTDGSIYLAYGSSATLPTNNMAIAYTPPAAISLSGSLVNYGYVLVGGNSSATVYVRSVGQVVLNISNVATSSGITPSFTAQALNPGDSVALVLNWNPTIDGAFSGNVVISSNAFNGYSDTIAVNGVAYLPAGVPAITISYTTLDNTAHISWVRPTGTVSGYNVYRLNSSGLFEPTALRLISTINDPDITSYLDVSVTNHYYYRVTAFNSVSSSSTAVVSLSSGSQMRSGAVGNTLTTTSRPNGRGVSFDKSKTNSSDKKGITTDLRPGSLKK